MGSWNIRDGLDKHEQEMRMWLKSEDQCVAFLVEVDKNNIDTPDDNKIKGSETIIPKTHKDKKK